MRERWFGATGRRVPEIAVEGDERVPLVEALVLDDVRDADRLRAAHSQGTPVVVRARTAEQVVEALSRPEVACALVPPGAEDLVSLDLTELTYG
ncbi:MAG: hypothetical protein ICV64_11270 [Thermoleophilia bacterium]|nr:hypothetical protein [Thermoleophilia bacterium]